MGKTGQLHAYPAQLAAFILARLADLGLPMPKGEDSEAVLVTLLSVVYQTSLLRDEDRPLMFRIGLAQPGAFIHDPPSITGPHAIPFDAPRPLTVNEVRKLAPAVKFQRSLIGVCTDCGKAGIWGIIHTGPRWLRFAQGGRGGAPDLPEDVLVIHAAAPGEIIVSIGAHTIARLAAGEVSTPMLDVFRAPWLPAMFAESRGEIAEIHEAERAASNEPWAPIDMRTVSGVGQNLLRRVIATIRASRHGGALAYIPVETDVDVLKLIDIKYRFADDEPRRRFRTIILTILRELARLGASLNSHKADFALYETTESVVIAGLDEATFELAHLMASLSDVDGMVVLTKRFEMLGFGGVVAGNLPEVNRVYQAMDLEGTTLVEEDTHTVGTRHRAAYRLAAALPNSLSIVVSQDGTARFVRELNGKVVYWDQIVWAAFGS